ncbi:transmembrane 4 L6 family member 20 [Ictidomys tridecemlineatus]|uniref:Transmembrane 4 L six family member 20 n=2 Tax=Marmotini TaxID=337730 RepID=I3MB49_ICTTR|nr:transmembrane 4 L6 family member 20 [Ictidomys tridecemlineatus]XP_027797848.1 transmembrane 4 L6 family member 20 [Marmota flaviventris]KAG3275430.1 transmembrane 4 L six family member 20 [Ictidomys tridecemlineatus]
MTCCEGWTSCNGICLLILLVIGVVLNAIPLGIDLVEQDKDFQNPISCYEWWFPGIIGAGLMVIPATTMSLAARKRGCCNNRTGMLLSSLLNAITVIGAVYCLLVSIQALSEGPLICNSPSNSTTTCEFSLKNLTDFHPKSFNLQWFFNDSCVPPTGFPNSAINNMHSNWRIPNSNSEEDRQRIFHFSVFLSLFLVGVLELLFGLSQIVIGFLGCLCGVSGQRSQIV